MADSRFFRLAGPFTLGHLAQISDSSLAEGADAALEIVDVGPLEQAGSSQLSFLDNRKYLDAFEASRAAACVINPALASRAPAGMHLLLSNDPYRSYALIAQAFYPSQLLQGGVHPSAWVAPDVVLGEGTEVGAGVVIEAGARVGAQCRIGPNAVIGQGVEIGDHGVVGANASISHALIGNHVYIYPGARIGQDGFGFAMGAKGHIKVPQLGRVIIEDDVEVGANSTIDRGAGPDTVIGRGSRIDNLVQIAHNVQIGRGCVVVAQTGISGSTKLGDFVVLGGQAGVAGHLSIGSGAKVAAQAGVMRNIPPGETQGGSPAVPQKAWLHQVAYLAKLARGKH